MSVEERIEQMIQDLQSVEADAATVDKKAYGWKAAVSRIRKALQRTSVSCKEVRKVVQETKNNG